MSFDRLASVRVLSVLVGGSVSGDRLAVITQWLQCRLTDWPCACVICPMGLTARVGSVSGDRLASGTGVVLVGWVRFRRLFLLHGVQVLARCG